MEKIDVEITFDGTSEIITIKNDLAGSVLIDDIRLHPYECGFSSYVFDYNNQRLLATLNNQNYATLYNYDNQGGLVQVKQETPRGILTLQTTRSNTRQNAN